MTYDAFESSVANGRPVEFFDFSLHDSQYNYTSAEDSILVGPTTYEPIDIERSTIILGADTGHADITIRMPSEFQPAVQYIDNTPGQRGTVTVKRFHRNDTGGGDPEVIVVYKGVIKRVNFVEDGHFAEMTIGPRTAGLGAEIPRYTYQSLCNHMLYDSQCQIAQGSFQSDLTVGSVMENILTIPGLDAEPDGHWSGGFVQYVANDFRLITAHTGNDIALMTPFPVDLTGEDVSVFAGCDHTLSVCKTKFDNVINFGGHAFVPLRNIFEKGIEK